MRALQSKSLNEQEQLAAAVELNSAEWIRRLACLPWVKIHEEPDVLWCFAGDTWPANCVSHARFKPTVARDRIREILACHWQHKVACNWIVGPLSQPNDLSKYLRDNGFSCRIHTAGMACNLVKLNAPVPPPPQSVEIAVVDELPSFVPLTSERRRHRHEGRKLIQAAQRNKIWYFSATWNGEPVGETTLLEGAGVGGVYDVEVRPEFRRRGIGLALVQAALQEARKVGLKVAVLGATGLGAGVYERAGFREVCKMSFWKYGKMRQLR